MLLYFVRLLKVRGRSIGPRRKSLEKPLRSVDWGLFMAERRLG